MSLLRTSNLYRACAVALLLCALAVRVLVPQGFMWSTGADGTPTMVICSGFGPMPAMPGMAADMQHHGGGHHNDGQSADHPCAFAAASTALDLATEIHPVSTPLDHSDVPTLLYIFARPGLGLAAPPPPKTGPPTLA
ncbi:MAG: hypothetical protein WCS75_02600 [Sphingomonas sp.]|jgi:hypothetical protein|uniref:hypothetical protein n=1 Tax=Sphingomonas sp. TaxID=28214 RepID=UPI0035686AA2